MIVELIEMRMPHGVDDVRVLELDRRLQNEVYPFLRGFVRRTTARGDDGAWAFVVLWGEEDNATAAASALDSDPVAIELRELAEEGTTSIRRYVTLD